LPTPGREVERVAELQLRAQVLALLLDRRAGEIPVPLGAGGWVASRNILPCACAGPSWSAIPGVERLASIWRCRPLPVRIAFSRS
jgi:hypothetical protein